MSTKELAPHIGSDGYSVPSGEERKSLKSDRESDHLQQYPGMGRIKARGALPDLRAHHRDGGCNFALS